MEEMVRFCEMWLRNGYNLTVNNLLGLPSPFLKPVSLCETVCYIGFEKADVSVLLSFRSMEPHRKSR